jgi:DNA-binding transcriptional ArsR family regulator
MTLASILSSKVRAEIFRHLFGLGRAEIHLRDLARRSGLSPATVRQDVRKLQGMDLVLSRRDGNRVYYKANYAHPLYTEIHGIVVKTSGLAEVLRRRLESEDIRVAFVFGSVAEGTERAESDVDLCVIGTASLKDLASRLAGIDDEIAREVNPFCLTPGEYNRRVKAKDHFLTNVFNSPKLFVRGTEHDLETMG